MNRREVLPAARKLSSPSMGASPLPPAPYSAHGSQLLGIVDGFVRHRHQRHGLGNVLFMINAALACDAEPVLVNTSNVIFGTSNAFGRRRATQPYTRTLLRNFLLVQQRPVHVLGALRGGHGAEAPLPACPNASFVVRTFAQSRAFAARVPKLLARLSWPPLRPAQRARYGHVEAGTCVGVRAGRDFSHRPISAAQYRQAFARLRALGEEVQPLLVLGDVPHAWHPFEAAVGERATQVDEDDVTQLAIARHCRNFVVSQSSFHVWMAYAALRPRFVLAFDGTDPSNVGTISPPWMAPWIVL